MGSSIDSIAFHLVDSFTTSQVLISDWSKTLPVKNYTKKKTTESALLNASSWRYLRKKHITAGPVLVHLVTSHLEISHLSATNKKKKNPSLATVEMFGKKGDLFPNFKKGDLFPFKNPNKQKIHKWYHGIPFSPQDVPARLNNFNVSDESWPSNELKIYFLLKMGIFQPAMLVYQRVVEVVVEDVPSLKPTAGP